LLTCKEFLKELADYPEMTVDAEVCRELKAHINKCSKCYVILDTTERTIKLYKGMQPEEVPEVVHVRLMAAVERKMAGNKPGTSVQACRRTGTRLCN
jgi:hypothetical protein